MNKIKNYLKLMRCHHYIKNILIFLPLVFSKSLFDTQSVIRVLLGTISFCFVASIVYIINDIKDVEIDKKHDKKKYRPIASGNVSIKEAILLIIILIVFSILINILLFGNNISKYFWIILYLVLNILYSIKLKHVPILDIVILAFGFLIRVFYGATIIDVEVSNWLYLTILSFSFYMGLGKRRNEFIKMGNNGRKVLQYYNKSFLDNNMYMTLALTIVFYALWCVDVNIANIIWTVPIIMIILMKYSLIIEGESHGDPVDVILENKDLLFLVIIYAILMFLMIYFI